MLHRKVRSGGRFYYRFLQMSPVLSVLKLSTRLVTAIVHIKIGAIYYHSRPIRLPASSLASSALCWVTPCGQWRIRSWTYTQCFRFRESRLRGYITLVAHTTGLKCGLPSPRIFRPWASAHRGKLGQVTPPRKMDEKLKSENTQKEQFSMFILYFESNRGRQV